MKSLLLASVLPIFASPAFAQFFGYTPDSFNAAAGSAATTSVYAGIIDNNAARCVTRWVGRGGSQTECPTPSAAALPKK